jgi:hypothetical protein
MSGTSATSSKTPWWVWVVAGDLALLSLIWFGEAFPRTPAPKAILSWLALQQEMNLAVWWSAAQLLLGALLMYERASTGSADERWPWAILAFISAGLSADEVGSIHERLGDRTWRPLIIVAVPLVAAVAWALVRLARNPARRREVALIVIAYGLFGGVTGLEYLESVVGWVTPQGFSQGLEEGTELVAFLLILFAAVGHRGGAAAGLADIIPDPRGLVFRRSVLTLAFLPHAVIALFIAHRLTDLFGRGNPIVCYPFAVYGLLVCQAVTMRRSLTAHRGAWGWLAGLFLICSIGAVFPLTNLTPYIDRVFRRWVYEGTWATHLFVLPPVLLLAGRILGWRDRSLRRVMAILALLVLVRLPGRIWWLDALTPGLVVYLWAWLFISPDAGRPTRDAARPSEPPTRG